MPMTSDQAETLIGAAKLKATEIGIAVSIVVLDFAGHLKAFSRMDGAWLGSIDIAMKKAKTSVLFEAETQALWDVCKPGAQAPGLEQTNGGLIIFAGGIPLKTSDGRLLGAIGVSGGQVAQDFEVARAGLAALDA
ncbi:MAG: heme-binding protein [Acetobacteraceae bacterium]